MSKLALLGGEKAVTTEPHSGSHHRSPMWESGQSPSWEEFSEAFAEKMQVAYALPVSSGTGGAELGAGGGAGRAGR